MINRAKLEHILEYAKQQRHIGLHCKVPPEDMVEIVEAAMLQGAEPVTTPYKSPANTPCKDAPEHIWLQTAGVWPENGEFSELTWCSDNQHKDDTLYVRADVVNGNSPVIPDDVRRMDWLVSKTVDVREPMVYGSHSLFWSQTITDEEDDYHATKLREQIDAAMEAEQAAAPQQEVTQALAKGMERYGDAMQKLADSGD
ncbi:hypothetical protein EKN35_23175 [Enterobacter asburiae]|nr:hypothetical protein EKN35_23175 [Enterobacter asburiae]